VYSFLFVRSADTIGADPGAAAAADDVLLAQLAELGCRLLGRCAATEVVHEAARVAPEIIICAAPGGAADALLDALAGLQVATPRPVLVLSDDTRPATLQRALDVGIHGWAVGWQWDASGSTLEAQRARLASELLLTHGRFTREVDARAHLADALARLDERKWVERAKGVLMVARQISEDDAFRLLRGASMHTNLRVGDVSRSVIEAAQLADAVNRAGQLRMLSQRSVRLLAQCVAGVEPRRSRELLDASQQQVRDNLERLQSLPASPLTAPALSEVAAAWSGLQPLLAAAPQAATLREADALAETLLARAERLTTAIEAASGRQAMHIVNVSGRQRMLVQRLAKDALLDGLLADGAARERVAMAVLEFGEALDLLDRAPLSAPEIRAALASARAEWLRMVQALRDTHSKSNRQALARGSEKLLASFDHLTGLYEHSLQVIMGG
jgi:AmiR/NasT family two-component response regulator